MTSAGADKSQVAGISENKRAITSPPNTIERIPVLNCSYLSVPLALFPLSSSLSLHILKGFGGCRFVDKDMMVHDNLGR